jgi:phosphoglycerate dehydrogenase-like enzyme
MNVLFLGGFAASQVEWIAPAIESDVQTGVLADDYSPERAAAIGEADIIVSEAWRAGMPAAPRLKLLQLPVAGTDRVETAALPPGVTVCNAYGHEMAMAEYAVMAMLVWSHRYFDIAIGFRAGSWRDSGVMNGPLHREVGGLTVGLVGLGQVGRPRRAPPPSVAMCSAPTAHSASRRLVSPRCFRSTISTICCRSATWWRCASAWRRKRGA